MNFPEKEKEVLRYWEENDIFKKTLEKQAPKGPFVFYEGPPTANGKPGIHHAESRAFKDCIPRFKTMQGYKVARKAGWDTHGLPVEIEVEKQLGFKSKSEIEEYGIAKFNEKCRESVWAYKEDWEAFTKRLGFWVDMDDAYITYKPEYIESLWAIIKKVWDDGYLYQDYRVTPHCPRCGTSLSSHELSQGYKDVKDLSVTAEFVVKEGSHEALRSDVPTRLIAWTTTPWTLPGNVALAVGPKVTYVVIEKENEGAEGRVRFVLAKELVEKIFEGSTYETVAELTGEDLVGTTYEPLYDFLGEVADEANKTKLVEKAYQVYGADFVTTEDGTGIVHTAVMYGADDFTLGNEIGLPKVHAVHLDGTFVKEAGFLAGRVVTDEDVAIDIIKDLAHRGLLFSKAKYEHSYPHCWRCKSKIIYYAKDSWYIAMSKLREKLLSENSNIHWEPSHLQEGRFGEWLREVKDWAFSRERYWATPLPIWQSEDGDRICIGSFEELRSLAKDPSLVGEEFDPHRPFVDEVLLKKDGKEYKRVADVCDVWFDSGSMPFAQWHYPFENKELIDSGEAFPADYISEAIDQTRGWFYTLLAVSTLMGKERPYKNVISLGHVNDADGKKMSKSIGNIVEPMATMEKHGADAVRWYMYSINQPGESKRFDEKMLSDMVRQNFGILMNVATFYEMYALESSPDSASEHILDKWILARLNKLTLDTTKRLEGYVITETVRGLGDFITDLSTWYVRRSRDRIKGTDEQDKAFAIDTLKTCLLTFSKLMAPFAPFLADTLYSQVGGKLESVHLDQWPEVEGDLIDETILSEMKRARILVTSALEARSESSIGIRQALASMTISKKIDAEYQQLLMDEVNVKAVLVDEGLEGVSLDTTLTPELILEGISREIIRNVNSLRKSEKLTIEDRITLYVSGADDAVMAHKETILHGTLADSIKTDGDEPAVTKTFSTGELQITVGFATL
jgi:isoleucyl-tRNA synthetase